MPRVNVGDIDRIQQVAPSSATLSSVQRTGDGARRQPQPEHEKPFKEDQVELSNEVEAEEFVSSPSSEDESGGLDLSA